MYLQRRRRTRETPKTSTRATETQSRQTSAQADTDTHKPKAGLTNRRTTEHPALANQTAQPGLRATSHKHTTRLAIRRHNRQFVQPTIGTEVLRRSLFGLVIVYNLLPQAVVDEKSVQSFQSSLQRALRNVARLGVPNWDCLFSPRLRPVRAFDFQRYFA